MSTGFFGFLKDGPSLLDESQQRALEMLNATREMFRIVIRAIQEEANPSVQQKIRLRDHEVNEGQQFVRQKVFEYLALSQGKNLLPALRLLTDVIDLERIGDYTKNMAELEEMFTGALQFGDYQAIMDEVIQLTGEMFALTYEVLQNAPGDTAQQVFTRYDRIAILCDSNLEKVMKASMGEKTVSRNALGLVLLLRYMKRVAAHLKNVCSAEVNPFHRIGFRPR